MLDPNMKMLSRSICEHMHEIFYLHMECESKFLREKCFGLENISFFFKEIILIKQNHTHRNISLFQ